MPRSFTGSRARGQRSQRLTQWGQGPGGLASNSLTGTGSQLLGSAIAFGAAGTVVRIRGWFDAYLSSYTTAGDGFQGAVGIGLVSEAAFDAGIASVPTPITEAAWDGWMWHQFFGAHGGLAAGSSAVGVGQGVAGVSREIDTKAMRKVSDEMVVFAVIEATEVGTAVLLVNLDSRLLLKLG